MTTGQSSVTFDRIPSNVNEFQQLQAQLAVEPKGAVAVMLIAMEMYRNNSTMGTECIKLCTTSSNVTSVTSRLREIFRQDDSYSRPYQVAAFLRGASPANGYNPSKPYTVDVSANPARPTQYSNDYEANIIFLQAKSNGHDSGSQSVDVVKPAGYPFYVVDNCPGLYSQVKKISYGQTFRGL